MIGLKANADTMCKWRFENEYDEISFQNPGF
jgi:hypothetical protein